MNPWDCGHLGDPRHACSCPSPSIERYRARISGPLLDRIDLYVELPAISLQELRARPGEPSVIVADRIEPARALFSAFGPTIGIDRSMSGARVRLRSSELRLPSGFAQDK